jgi:hypothetical protein
MNGRLQAFLSFLDLLAEGQRRQAEAVTGRRFGPVAAPAPVEARSLVRQPALGHRGPRASGGQTRANGYTTVSNTSIAAILVAALAGLVSNALALDQRVILERDASQVDFGVLLPEVVVSASRLEQ